MSSFNKSVLLGSLLFTLISCQKSDSGTSAVDKEGNCKQETIDTYNNVSSSYYLKSASELQSSCQSYKNLIGSQTCMAVNVKTGLTTSINSTSLDSICERKISTEVPKPLPTQPVNPNKKHYDNADYCSDKTIHSYNQLIASMKAFLSNPSESDLQNVIADCKSFKETTSEKECSAINSYNEKIVISYNKFKSACDSLQPLQPTQDTSAEISSLKQGVKITITNAQKMNLLLQKGRYVKGGRIGSKKLIDAAGTCRVEKKSPQILFQNRQTVILSEAQNVQNATIIDDSRSPFSIVCIRKNFTKGTTLRDLENIFGNIIDVKINE